MENKNPAAACQNADSAAPAPEGLARGADGKLRCFWVGQDPLYQLYHDEEWGLPPQGDKEAQDRYIFEKICLEGFQAGLSWRTILHKRAALRAAFHNFDFRLLSAQNAEAETEELRTNAAIIRHKGKIAAVFSNARATQNIVREFGSLQAYIRQFLPPAEARRRTVRLTHYQNITSTAYSADLAKDLKKRGFKFFGPIAAYAFMQALGMVNDHIEGCFRCAETQASQQAFYADTPPEFDGGIAP